MLINVIFTLLVFLFVGANGEPLLPPAESAPAQPQPIQQFGMFWLLYIGILTLNFQVAVLNTLNT